MSGGAQGGKDQGGCYCLSVALNFGLKHTTALSSLILSSTFPMPAEFRSLMKAFVQIFGWPHDKRHCLFAEGQL
jgi:hypothetical protein